jgi:hypothetical protein
MLAWPPRRRVGRNGRDAQAFERPRNERSAGKLVAERGMRCRLTNTVTKHFPVAGNLFG